MSLKLIAATCVAASTMVAAPASATTASLSPDGRFLEVTESIPGEVNDVRVSVAQSGGVQVLELFQFEGITPGAGCATVGAIVRCQDPIEQVRLRLGAGDDRVETRDTTLAFGIGALDVDLGDGNDLYTAEEEQGIAVVRGGAGNDDLRGGIGNDDLDGGPGDDKVNGFSGLDAVRGGDGNDEIKADSYSDKGIFADVIDGGAGADTLVDYRFSGEAARAPAINVSLDGAANDGRPGEGDNVVGIERLDSGSAGSFTGDDGANEFVAPQTGAAGVLRGLGGDDVLISGDAHGDVVEGGAGADTIEGGFGDDKLVGGPGRDTIAGDRKTRCNEMACDLIVSGNDTVEARDGEVDSVSCGIGTDRVIADPDDVVAADCETVERAAVGGKPDGTTNPEGKKKTALTVRKVSLRKALKSGLRVTVTNVSGTVTLKAKRAKKTVATGKAKAKGGKATVVLKFTKKARRSLARSKKVTLTISGAGATKKLTLKR
ncbi:MAG: hypothetical protein JHC95_15540 [Solirubrobacteraceae bacterium]|nr:hypothetical protein [Solirubrobacteraceae bacterium]